MARLTVVLIGVLATHFINCAPNERSNSNLHKSVNHEPRLNDDSYSVVDNDEVIDSRKNTQRQKRWYNNFPPYIPPYVRAYDTGSQLEDNLSNIQTRLQEILDMVKAPPPQPPPPTFYPVYVPVYIPQPQCGCNPTTTNDPTTITPALLTPTTNAPNETVPNLNERLPEMEDERQNWGILVNNTLSDYDDDDGSRPISLTPIVSGNDGGVPAPPVDHGSKQADISDVETQTVTTAGPVVFQEPVAPSKRPDACDSAIMSCCFGLDRTYKCVQSRGCRDRSIGPNPCNRQTVLGVLSRVQSYYG